MKRYFFFIIILALISCSTTQLVDSWKNPEIASYAPNKVLVVAMTPNIKARQKFEQQVKLELELRGIEVVMSLDVFDSNLRTEKMTQEELEILENKLLDEGFDTVLFSKVVGVEDKIAYKKKYYNHYNAFKSFSEDYLMNQDIYYNPEYYDEYTVYHSETALYCICPTKDRELIWKGSIDVVDPISIEDTVNDYVNLILTILEKEKLINEKLLIEETLN